MYIVDFHGSPSLATELTGIASAKATEKITSWRRARSRPTCRCAAPDRALSPAVRLFISVAEEEE
jgi:hypothetical protein